MNVNEIINEVDMEEIDIVSAPPGLGILRYVKLPEIWEGVKKKCRKWFSRTRRIVLYGESGSGKTQFLHTLLGKQEDFDEQRTQTIVEYPFELSDGHKVIFIDTPGNQSLDYIRKTLQERYAKNEICGIINVVSNGYQSIPTTNQTQVFNVDSNEVKPQYLSMNKERELRQLEEWKSFVTARSGVKWFVTIVNKADIWYADMEETMEYYNGGRYHEAIRELINVCDVMTYPFCSIIAPFYGRMMPLVMSQKDQWVMIKSFKKKLINLIVNHG